VKQEKIIRDEKKYECRIILKDKKAIKVRLCRCRDGIWLLRQEIKNIINLKTHKKTKTKTNQ
jgi:Zn-finger nucleic acid-binding protein